MDSINSFKAKAMRAIAVGDKMECRIYSGTARVEIFDVEVVEVFAAVCRVKLWNGNILRVSVAQLKHF
jgi:hypothetical protein